MGIAAVLIERGVLPRALCAQWLALIDDTAARLPAGHVDLLPATDSLRLPALGSPWLDEVLALLGTRLADRLPADAQCLVGQSWARRQHPPATRPVGQWPHSWHQDGALHSRFTASDSDAVLDITTVWLPLVDCGQDAPSLEWIEADDAVGLLLPPDLEDGALARRFGAAARRHAQLATGDALIFGGGQLHRTHVTPAMHRRRVSIELRFIAGGATPPRLEREPRVAAFRCSSTR